MIGLFKHMLFAAVAGILLVGCSVKENRWGCPTVLVVESTEELPPKSTSVVTVYHSDLEEMMAQVRVDTDSLFGGHFHINLPHRGNLEVSVICGIKDMDLFDGLVCIRDAKQCDSLFRLKGTILADTDSVFFEKEPQKEFTTLSFRINNTNEPYMFKVKGLWDRVYAGDFRPGRGNLRFDVNDEFYPGTNWSCRLSRQGDEQLEMEVYRKTPVEQSGVMTKGGEAPANASGEEYHLWRSVPLGRIMTLAGYDRDAVPMQDVSVDVDLTEGIVSIRVGDWDKVYDYNIYTF